jgi:hypothetical protein
MCIEGKPFSLVVEAPKLIQEFSNNVFCDTHLTNITAGIIQNPDEYLLQLCEKLRKCNDHEQCDIQILSFASIILKLRDKEIAKTTKSRVIDLFIGFSNSDSDFLILNASDSQEAILHALLATESELIFDYVYDYFIEHYKELNFASAEFWKYFILFPGKFNKRDSYEFRKNLFHNYQSILTSDYITYLHKYHAKEMLLRYAAQFYTSKIDVDLPHIKPHEEFLRNERVQEICRHSLSLFWQSLNNEILDNHHKEWLAWLMEKATYSIGGANEYKIFSSFCSALLYSCSAESTLEVFLEKILFAIVRDKESFEQSLDIELLTKRIAINRHFTEKHTRVLHKIINVVANMDIKVRINAYRMWSKNIKIKNLLIPIMARKFRADINSENNEVILDGLVFFRSIFFEINKEDTYVLLKLIRHDDERIRKAALRNLAKLKLSDAILNELIDFIFDTNIHNPDYLIEKSIALSCLFKASKYYACIASESNIFEPLLMVEIQDKKNNYLRLRNPQKMDDFIKSISVGIEYGDLVKELLEIASEYSIPFLIGLREFTFKQDGFLYRDLTKGIYEIRTRHKRISLFIKRNPDFLKLFSKLKEKINIPNKEHIRMLSELKMQELLTS